MSSSQDPNPVAELTERFRADLARPVAERYYSEDDLIDIFDYAGDMGDDYVRLEALMLGARLYPDSIDLKERRAIFYLYLDQKAFQSFLDDNPTMDTPLWQILRLNLLKPGQHNVEAILQSFIDHASRLTDEEVIQFVQLAAGVGALDWVLAHLDELRAHVDYLPTLLYEVAAQAEDRHMYDRASELVAELTDLEPYNPDYWTMHATLAVMRHRPDEAAADIEYALAIDPDNLEALRAKLGVVSETGTAAQFDELADRILTRDPADTEVALMALEHTDDDARVSHILDILHGGHAPWSYELAIHAARIGYASLEDILTDLATDNLTDPQRWHDIARAAFRAGQYNALSTIMTVYARATGTDLDCAGYLYEILYRSGKYDTVIQMYLASHDTAALADEDGGTYRATAMFVTALLRSGHTDSARTFLRRLLDEIAGGATGDDGDELKLYALRIFAGDTLGRIDRGDTDWQTYDPLGLDR